MNIIWKSFKDIKVTPSILQNVTSIPLHLKESNYRPVIDTPQHYSKTNNFVDGTWEL